MLYHFVFGIFTFSAVFYLSTLYDFYTESQFVITKEPPSLKKYISSELESRARLGNHLFELSSLIGIARSLNRTPVFFMVDEGYKWCLEDTNKTAPGLADQFLVIDGAVPKTIRNTVFHTRCCIYEDPRVLSNIEDEHIHLTGRFYQSYKYFEGMRNEQLSWLKESPAEFPGLPKSDGRTHVMCVHVRRGDFLGVGFQASDAHFIKNAVEYIKEKENTKKPLKTVVYFGDDPEFMKSIFNGTKLAKDNLSKNATYVISQNLPSDDMLYSKSNCEVFLLSASHSTFGWWLGYFSINNKVYYMDMRVNYVGAYKDGKVNIKDYFLASWTPLKFANDNSTIIVGDY
ncbi:hypothetical protein GCK72_020933 [Caenorhabditis remanei]|uniref:L-Fucosyltransferase n=1 Tax=Caenorhabditis remanei TaxID=31234 RepID=A0A6A5GIL3_CAERE|nr:hypothetical protein GCK72_020933 [Caenorhabditis remanei]KAF1754372.1 hypothetical protein GCK72_020933 [Caenorhabditis remanei]